MARPVCLAQRMDIQLLQMLVNNPNLYKLKLNLK
jgi:hypothetical protein